MTEQENSTERESEIGRAILKRIRAEANNEYAHFSGEEGEDVFETLYLKERDICMPEHLLGDDVLMDIRALFSQVFGAIREELEERLGHGQFIWLAVDPSYEDSTLSVMCTDEKVLFLHWSKAWNFYWQNEDEMALEMGRLYQLAERGLQNLSERTHEP